MFSINLSQILHTYAKKKVVFFFVRKSNLTRHPVYLFIKPGTPLLTKWKFCLWQQYAQQQTLDHDWSKSVMIIQSLIFPDLLASGSIVSWPLREVYAYVWDAV